MRALKVYKAQTTISLPTTALVPLVLCALIFPRTVWGESLNGFCFNGGECAGLVRIEGNSFGLCEESCELSNPVTVSGMDATLYDAVCTSDHSGPLQFRLFSTRYGLPAPDGSLGLMLLNDASYPLVSCDGRTESGVETPEVEALIQRFFEYADLCRGGGADIEDVEKRIEVQEQRCEDSARIEIDLNQNHSFCYGTEGQATAEYEWHKCGLESNYRPFEPYD